MDPKSLRQWFPRDKNDTENAKVLVSFGLPQLEPVLPRMLEWLKTRGSPVESIMSEFFVQAGEASVPVVRKALASRHDLLKYSVVSNVVAKWPREAVSRVAPELLSLATGSGFYGTDLIALRLLTEYKLADGAWLKQWAEFKVKRLRELLSEAERIGELLANEGKSVP
jgi:uncharacterized protein DUF5071